MQYSEERILEVITTIRESSPIAIQCHYFSLILQSIFPGSEEYYNSDHAITKIGNKFYDLNGVVEHTERFLPLNAYGPNTIKALEQGQEWFYKGQVMRYLKDRL